jgi:hypothetical protein
MAYWLNTGVHDDAGRILWPAINRVSLFRLTRWHRAPPAIGATHPSDEPSSLSCRVEVRSTMSDAEPGSV